MDTRSSESIFDPRHIQILYEDNHLIAVFKPSGLLTQGDATGAPCLMDEIKAWLKKKYKKPGNVFLGLLHRLDKPAAGVVLFAKTSKGASRLSEQIRERKVEKIYHAWVRGCVKPSSASVTHYMSLNSDGRIRIFDEEAPGAKKAKLHYLVLKCLPQKTLLRVNLETGRKHQIRAQLAHLGHPILGDHHYGDSAQRNEIALLAKRLEFWHPIDINRKIVVETRHNLDNWETHLE